MAEQLPLPLPAKQALGREDFFVSTANELAVSALENPANWPLGKLVLVGPPGAGKTHLAHVWAGDEGAEILTAAALADLDIDQIATRALVIEDLPILHANAKAQTALFHLHNLMAERGLSLLMTSATPPNHLNLDLRDLQSRLSGTSVVEIGPPDEPLLQVVLMKLFNDRQINPEPGFFDYVLPRLPRSFAAARKFVTQMDARALAEGRAIGPRLAGEVLTTNLDFDCENP